MEYYFIGWFNHFVRKSIDIYLSALIGLPEAWKFQQPLIFHRPEKKSCKRTQNEFHMLGEFRVCKFLLILQSHLSINIIFHCDTNGSDSNSSDWNLLF
jgi:hypothetical protein